jgi:hypothetical protein
MQPKSQVIYIGVIDFLSVILPGVLVAYFLKELFYANDFFKITKKTDLLNIRRML